MDVVIFALSLGACPAMAGQALKITDVLFNPLQHNPGFCEAKSAQRAA
jgi:hypothetical protein